MGPGVLDPQDLGSAAPGVVGVPVAVGKSWNRATRERSRSGMASSPEALTPGSGRPPARPAPPFRPRPRRSHGRCGRRPVLAVETDNDPHIARVGAEADGRVEGDPAEALRIGLRPGVRAGFASGFVSGAIAADEARRNIEEARAGDENMGEVARPPAPERKGFDRRTRDRRPRRGRTSSAGAVRSSAGAWRRADRRRSPSPRSRAAPR